MTGSGQMFSTEQVFDKRPYCHPFDKLSEGSGPFALFEGAFGRNFRRTVGISRPIRVLYQVHKLGGPAAPALIKPAFGGPAAPALIKPAFGWPGRRPFKKFRLTTES